MASSAPPQWIVATSTDVGRVRAHNEDRCATFANGSGARLLVVADGMGGHRGGATASRLAIEALGAALARNEPPSQEWLERAIHEANEQVYAAAQRDAALSGMGSTLVAILAAPDDRAWVGHVGDSRAYRLRDGELEVLTEDHSVVAEMIRRGLITPEEALVHPRRNEILRSIGVDADVEPEVRELDVRAGDRLLLCSDGLCGVVEDRELGELLAEHPPAAAALRAIEVANDAGGPDNITAIVAEVPAKSGAQPTRPGSGSTVAIVLIAALVLALGMFAFEMWH